MSIRKMNLKLLFCVIFILVGSVETRMSHRKKNCTTCNPIQKSLCDHGQCEIERDCSAFGCICDKGWTGDMCNEECKRNCTRGHCYIIEKEERCACPEGYTSDSNCMEKETNVSLLHFLKGLNSTILTVSPAETKNPETDHRWLIFAVVIPISMICSFTLLFYQLWRRRISFAVRIVHYFHWQSSDENKEYDAFVSFRSCSKDETWVLNTLFPKLEEEMGFRLCIHLRDFQAGELISNNIIDAIEKSRRTILVISPDYVTSEWTRMEYQMAQVEMLKLRHKIIPIIFRDVSDSSSIDKCLKFILKTVTYIKWPGDTDTKGQRRFWEQLKVTMPKMTVVNETEQ